MSRKRAVHGTDDGSSSSDLEDYVHDKQEALAHNSSEESDAGKAAGGSGKIKAGTFGGMGLMPSLLKALTKLGYRQPTPIQRKTIPLLLAGKDVVAMARTGSGKTAAFGLACLQRLQAHSPVMGARALILCPNRELALQTEAVLKKLAVGTDLRLVSLIGGDELEAQFTSLAANPDCIIATPGRLAHLLAETGLSLLNRVEMVILDEADRLLEDASLAEQCRSLLSRLPPAGQRQTTLFSATLPAALVELAQAGLVDPQLVRLDAETKLSPDLETVFIAVKTQSRDALLLHLLDHLKDEKREKSDYKKGAKNDFKSHAEVRRFFPLTCLFVPTKHHVEYLSNLIRSLTGLACAGIHGSMDQQARAIAIGRFRAGEVRLLVVTDVAARGLDIPLLDTVINYTFPATPKLFVHRVGRVARAGRAGRAWSLVTNDELPLLVEVALFLGRRVGAADTPHVSLCAATAEQLYVGGIPQTCLDEQQERIASCLDREGGMLASEAQVAANAMRMYLKTRPAASPESHRRAKELLAEHPVWPSHWAIPVAGGGEEADPAMLAAIKAFKPRQSHVELPALKLKRGEEDRPASSQAGKKPHSRPADFCLEYRPADDKAAEERGYSLAQAKRHLTLELAGEDTLTKSKQAKKLKAGKERADQQHIAAEYGRWQARTKLAIARAGEQESTEQIERATDALQRLQQRGQWRSRGGKRGGHRGSASKK